MKKIALAVLCVSLFSLTVHTASAQVKYAKKEVLLNFGIGSSYYYAGGTPFVASAEFFINDAISIGPYLGITSFGYRYPGNRINYTFIDVGARGSYHFSKHLNLGTNKLDLYGGALIGFVSSNYKDNSNTTYVDPYGNTARGGVFGGARWYFSNAFSVNGELAVGGVAPLLIGISFKL
jgi:hypothetical protein